MRIVVAGGTGFLGGPLCASLAASGHDVVALSRRGAPAPPAGSVWTGTAGMRTVAWPGDHRTSSWAHVVDGADVVVNLAGESIADRRWSDEQKRRLLESRVDTTRAIGEAIAAAAAPPSRLINASAIGYYGDRGDETLVEASACGRDFLARLVTAWEETARRAGGASTRVTLLRTGIVLDARGGALPKMITPFKLLAGGPFGAGRQYMSWIHEADWRRMVTWLLTITADGPFNATAPEPATNAVFARALGRALGRPSLVPTPGFALRLALGEMADPLLLYSQRVVPRRALDLGFAFEHPDLDEALRSLLG